MHRFLSILFYLFSKSFAYKQFLLFALLALLSTGASSGQELVYGYPLLRNYSPEEMGAEHQNWKIVQDKRGVLYIANGAGVIEYDGIEWREITIEDSRIAYEMEIADDGTIYVGSMGTFGMLCPDSSSKMQYLSLMDLAPAEFADFDARIYQILCKDDKVHFIAAQYIFTYLSKEKRLEVFPYKGEGELFRASIHNKSFYISDFEYGLMILRGDSLHMAPGGDFFYYKSLVKMMQTSGDHCYIFTNISGIYLYNLLSGESKPMLLDSTLQKDITEKVLYNAIELPSGDIELNTLYGGSYIFTKDLEVKHLINKKTGIRDEVIISCMPGKDQSIWYGLNSGLAHINLQLPIYRLNKEHGLKGLVWDITVCNSHLVVATTNGLFLCDLEEAQPGFIEILDEKGLSLGETRTISHATSAGEDHCILVGSLAGLVMIKIDKDRKDHYVIVEKSEHRTYYHTITQSKYDPELFYVRALQKIFYRRLEKDTLAGFQYLDAGFQTSSLLETEKNIVWVFSPQGLLVKLDYNTWLTKKYFLSDSSSRAKDKIFSLFYFEKELYALSDKGVFKYHRVQDKFEESSLFNEVDFLADKQLRDCMSDSAGNIYIGYMDLFAGEQQYFHGLLMRSGQFKDQFLILNELRREKPETVHIDDGVAWYAYIDEIIAVDQEKHLEYLDDSTFNLPACLIRSISFSDSCLIYGGSEQSIPDNLMIPFINRNFKISWSHPYYFNEENTLFRYQLSRRKVITENSWERRTELQLMNLRPGTYHFTVEALTAKNEIGPPATFAFRILPPWYMTWYMYILYSILFLCLIYLSFKIYSRKLIRDKNRLESIVEERTVEIRDQKELIEKKNNQISGSIDYARHIQSSVLLTEEDIKADLPNCFIYNKPRDVVSGDFYWFNRQDNRSVIAAVDCTGHGVPGAFMSMIGSTLLNDIVIKENISKPSEILNKLNIYIKETLHQDRSRSQAQDGMDISICTIDHSSGTLQFAGAKNPLYLLSKGELEIIKADLRSIGGRLRRNKQTEEIKFTNHTMTLKKGVNIYMASDGYLDQFGGEKGEKYSTARFKELLKEVSGKAMEEQKSIITQQMDQWKNAG